MRKSIIATIFRKEIKEVLRDKRMLYLVILMPFFLYPVMFTLIGSIGASQQEKLQQEKFTVLLSPEGAGSPIEALLKQDTSLTVVTQSYDKTLLDSMSNTIGITLPADFAQQWAEGQSVKVSIMADQSDDAVEMRCKIIDAQLQALNEQMLQERLTAKELPSSFARPLAVEQIDIAEEKQAARVLASFLPMMVLLFIFIGCIYIAIDITAGEKERRTLQTLFTAPVSTGEIIAGKFAAVSVVGIVSAAMNLLSLLLAMNIQIWFMSKSSSTFSISMSGTDWGWMALLILLATLFLGALSLAVVLLANTYKEAQSYVSPLMMIVMIPSMLAGMPGAELNNQTALIPVYNVALAIADLLKGNAQTSLLLLVAGVSLAAGLLALYLASLTFGNENVITGEKVDFKSLLSRRKS
ncbi:MAG: ABC transporter permease [Saprospiraceae bacterium]